MPPLFRPPTFVFIVLAVALVVCELAMGQVPPARILGRLPVVAWTEHKVEILRNGAKSWDPASTNTSYNRLNPGDQLRTLENSRAGLLMSDYKGAYIVGERSLFIVRSDTRSASLFELIKGRLFHLHRGPAAEQHIRTPTVAAVIRGTEYVVEVAEDGTTTLSLLNGEVELQNTFGQLTLRPGEQSITEPGRAPRRTAVILGTQVVQWCLYYPGVLSLDELPSSIRSEAALAESLSAYQAGDLPGALAAYPAQRKPVSPEEVLFQAALLLSIGNVEGASALLETPATASRPAAGLMAALRRMIAIVQGAQQTGSDAPPVGTATEALVASYQRQAARQLDQALVAARHAVEMQPEFGFGWVRVAELEFGFGRNREARAALETGLRLSPRNAQAVALEGFLHAAEDRISAAMRSFDRAIALDGALGNAWLGRGLCRFRRGEREGALEDLQMAAALEPQRSLPRSYLAKAWSESGLDELALRDAALAQTLDPSDPTAWLYSGLIQQRLNRLNNAIGDLEHSRALNDNRALFRSRQLLDQDLAVRSANLSTIYHDAGLADLGRATAAGAVNADYANYSAHLFLADSFNALRDPRQINQRYETPWLSELLLAHLLSPSAAGTLARGVSPMEYSRLLARDGWNLRSTARYSSHGDWWINGFAGAQYDDVSVAMDATRLELEGYASNTDTRQWSYDAKLKLDAGSSDSVLINVVGYENQSGDVRDYYNPRWASRTLRFEESQEPNIYAGWRHEWAPGSRTLVLAARLIDDVALTDRSAALPVVARTGTGTPTFAGVLSPFELTYASRLEGYSLEAQHLLQSGRNMLIVGVRYQEAEVRSATRQFFDPLNFPPTFFGTANPALSFARQSHASSLRRLSGYAYEHLEVVEGFRLLAGMAYEMVESPGNASLPPLADSERKVSQWSPKAGFSWQLSEASEFRGMYARALGGTYYDSSIRLEPAQLLGFPQVYRSTIPESVVGAVPGTEMDVAGGEWMHRFPSRTYLSIRADGLWSSAHRKVGSFSYVPPATAAQLRQALDYQELGFEAAVDQLLGAGGSVGIRYRASETQLDLSYPELPATLPNDGVVRPRQHMEGMLQTVQCHAAYTHRLGWYVGGDATFYVQDNDYYSPGLPDDSFLQCNLRGGLWFLRRNARLQLDFLNVTDQDYRLNPLNLHASLPRERTLLLSLKVSL